MVLAMTVLLYLDCYFDIINNATFMSDYSIFDRTIFAFNNNRFVHGEVK